MLSRDWSAVVLSPAVAFGPVHPQGAHKEDGRYQCACGTTRRQTDREGTEKKGTGKSLDTQGEEKQNIKHLPRQRGCAVGSYRPPASPRRTPSFSSKGDRTFATPVFSFRSMSYGVQDSPSRVGLLKCIPKKMGVYTCIRRSSIARNDTYGV